MITQPDQHPYRQPHTQHRRHLGHRHTAMLSGPIDIPAGLTIRQSEPDRENTDRLHDRSTLIEQFSGSIDTPRPLLG